MENNIEVKKSITITSYNMVRPADETPRETLWLSTLDMIRRQPYSHTHVLFVYPPNKIDNIINPLSSPPTFFDTSVLKESLSKALVPYYPMAGRVKVNENTGRYEIDCNAEGALFIEAETLHKLTDLGSETNPNTELQKELIPVYDYTKKLSTIPLLLVQVTRFKCGGVCLGFSQHHHVADGAAHVGFINSWGRLARGLDLTAKPVHDRFKYMAPRDPPQVKFLDLHYLEPPLPSLSIHGTMTSTVTGTFKLSDSQIKVLKQEAMSSKELSGYEVTTYTVLAGHVWRSVCKARKLADDQDVKLYTQVDGRQSLNLPLGYVGNAVVCAASKAKAGDVMHKPLWYTTKKISEAVKKMKDSESFRSAIDYIESQPSLEPLIRGEYSSTCPNMSINSWVKMPITKSDFGWGAPKFIRNGGCRYEGQSFLLAGENGDGSLLLNIILFSHHMALLEKYLYEF